MGYSSGASSGGGWRSGGWWGLLCSNRIGHASREERRLIMCVILLVDLSE